MKIVAIVGVGFHDNLSSYEKCLSKIVSKMPNPQDWQTEVFVWNHFQTTPNSKQGYATIRKFVSEVILDFQYVMLHGLEVKLPEADYYIAHSAGSVLALALSDKPCVIMGSPAKLVEYLVENTDQRALSYEMIAKVMKAKEMGLSVVNVVNNYDVIAHVLEWPKIKDVVICGSKFNPMTYEPFSCHVGYWDNSDFIKIAVDSIKGWEAEKMEFPEGREQLATAMVEPIRMALDYEAMGRRLLPPEPI